MVSPSPGTLTQEAVSAVEVMPFLGTPATRTAVLFTTVVALSSMDLEPVSHTSLSYQFIFQYVGNL